MLMELCFVLDYVIINGFKTSCLGNWICLNEGHHDLGLFPFIPEIPFCIDTICSDFLLSISRVIFNPFCDEIFTP